MSNGKDSLKLRKAYGDGDCAFHAVFGEWDESKNKLFCKNVEIKRKAMADKLRSWKNGTELYQRMLDRIKEIIYDTDITAGECIEAARQKFLKMKAEAEEVLEKKWNELYAELSKLDNNEVSNFIKKATDGTVSKENFNKCWNDYRESFLKLNISKALRLKIDEWIKEEGEVNWDEFFDEEIIEENIIEEYLKIHIEKKRVFLTSPEIELIAHAFDIKIQLNAKNPATEEIYPANQPYNSEAKGEIVVIRFDGVNHFDRELNDEAFEALKKSSESSSVNSSEESALTGGIQQQAPEDSSLPKQVNSVPVERKEATKLFKRAQEAKPETNQTIIAYLDKDKKGDYDFRGKHGETALHWAAYHANLELVEALIMKGADKDAIDVIGKNQGNLRTPLMWAALRILHDPEKYLCVINKLHELGADPGIRDHRGRNTTDILNSLYNIKKKISFGEKFRFFEGSLTFYAPAKKLKDLSNPFDLHGDDSSDEEMMNGVESYTIEDAFQAYIEQVKYPKNVFPNEWQLKLVFCVHATGLQYLYSKSVNSFYYHDYEGKCYLGQNSFLINKKEREKLRGWVTHTFLKTIKEVIYCGEEFAPEEKKEVDRILFGVQSPDDNKEVTMGRIEQIINNMHLLLRAAKLKDTSSNLAEFHLKHKDSYSKDIKKLKKEKNFATSTHYDTVIISSPEALSPLLAKKLATKEDKLHVTQQCILSLMQTLGYSQVQKDLLNEFSNCSVADSSDSRDVEVIQNSTDGNDTNIATGDRGITPEDEESEPLDETEGKLTKITMDVENDTDDAAFLTGREKPQDTKIPTNSLANLKEFFAKRFFYNLRYLQRELKIKINRGLNEGVVYDFSKEHEDSRSWFNGVRRNNRFLKRTIRHHEERHAIDLPSSNIPKTKLEDTKIQFGYYIHNFSLWVFPSKKVVRNKEAITTKQLRKAYVEFQTVQSSTYQSLSEEINTFIFSDWKIYLKSSEKPELVNEANAIILIGTTVKRKAYFCISSQFYKNAEFYRDIKLNAKDSKSLKASEKQQIFSGELTESLNQVIRQAIINSGFASNREKMIAEGIRDAVKGKVPNFAEFGNNNIADFVSELTYLLFFCESSRNPASFIVHQMMLDLILADKMSWEQAFTGKKTYEGGCMPMSMKSAVSCACYLHNTFADYMPLPYGYEGKIVTEMDKVAEFTKRTVDIIQSWLRLKEHLFSEKARATPKKEAKKTQIEFFKKEPKEKDANITLDRVSVGDIFNAIKDESWYELPIEEQQGQVFIIK